MRAVGRAVVAMLSLAIGAGAEFVNWENNPVHPVAISPDGALLAVANLPAAQVELLSLADPAAPAPVASIPVGLDPVTVRFRSNGELWVVNHISDSVSIIDLAARRIRATLPTGDEPADVVFAGEPQRAFVSCSQVNEVMVVDPDTLEVVARLDIVGEDPRAMAVSPDGSTVYTAVFESGNNTTVLAGGFSGQMAPGFQIQNAVSHAQGPYGGVNPPPNSGTEFEPPLSAETEPLIGVSLIVRKDAAGRWRDDNGRDWTAYVSGSRATLTGRPVGWDLYDHDLAVIDAATLAVSYRTGLMNINMALAVNPQSGEVTVVGTDSRNEVRFEPNLRGDFIKVLMARVPVEGSATITNLNPHAAAGTATLPPEERALSLGDPRGIAWSTDGARGWITGLGSDNVIEVESDGSRTPARPPLAVGEGPSGIAPSADGQWLYIYNRFSGSLSVVDVQGWSEELRLALFDPTPDAIRQGRRFLYNTHLTSGNGVHSCASCHVDMRTDRLAWDLGDPSGGRIPISAETHNTTLIPLAPFGFPPFHPMKGPMLTQTLQDIIGHEPFHWRGDRRSIEEFNPTFTALMAADRELDAEEMARVKEFLATLTFPPNPYRNLDNSLSTQVPLKGLYRTARFGTANKGQPMPDGNAVNGLSIYTRPGIDRGTFSCSACHVLGTGGGTNYRPRTGGGFEPFPPGPNGEAHLTMVGIDGSTNISMKVPQMRNIHERTGFDLTRDRATSGFGTFHDGTMGSVADFVSIPDFNFTSDQAIADVIALVYSLSGGGFATNTTNSNLLPAPASRDSHAAVGYTVTITGADGREALDRLTTIAAQTPRRVDLIARTGAVGAARGWVYEPGAALFQGDDRRRPVSAEALLAGASQQQPLTLLMVPFGMGTQFGVDRDLDGFEDGVEQGSGTDPFDAAARPSPSHFGVF